MTAGGLPIPGDEARTPSQARRLFGALDRHGVRYLTVGGFAVQIHGHERTTRDLDIVVERSRENLGRLATALGELGAELRGIHPGLPRVDLSDRRTIEAMGTLNVTCAAGEIDIFIDHEMLAGAAPWERLRERAITTSVAGVPVTVVGRDDLISMKRAASKLPGRAPDKAAIDRKDVDVLTARREDLERAAQQLRERRAHEPPDS